MRPRRTPRSNKVFRLVGGNEDNDLWLEMRIDDEGLPILQSVWELTEKERAAVAEGANIALVVWGPGHPPVAMSVTDQPLGRA